YKEAKNRTFTDEFPEHDPDCPFCPGNEELDLETERISRSGEWQVRSVYNKYPALMKDEKLVRSFDGVQRLMTGAGHHEVLIEHPKHNTCPALMTPAENAAAIELFYNRGWAIQKDARIEQIIYFENHGRRAGASLQHPHGQIIALPVVPRDIRRMAGEAWRYFDDTGECVFCMMLKEELQREERLVAETEHFVAFVLYAALSPFHIWIFPRRHSVNFLYTTAEERADLGGILRNVLRRLYIGLRDPAYNTLIRTAPVKQLDNEYFHWYISIVPRLSRTAGFELGSGMFINPTLPEACAAFLRGVRLGEGAL
ncbi:MAG TPA: HIT domain-containing protein, partial [Chloroflexi bacterium]|nr:HIT domain-containing protein [Chloroflexota bacterium]